MEEKFDIDLIQKLKAKNAQIDNAKSLVNKHVAVSRVFELIQQMTASDVRFTGMDLKGSPENTGSYTLSLKGQGKNLATVAFQASVFSNLANYGLEKKVTNPMITSQSFDTLGAVSFDFSSEISRDSISYKGSVLDDINK
jgi:hypothetical protein